MNLKELTNQKKYYKVLDSTFSPTEKTKSLIGKVLEEIKNDRVTLNSDGNPFVFNKSDLQEMTPLFFKEKQIGIGDDVKHYNEWHTVYGYHWYDGRFVLNTVKDNDFDNRCLNLKVENITNHRPLSKNKPTEEEIKQAEDVLRRAGKL